MYSKQIFRIVCTANKQKPNRLEQQADRFGYKLNGKAFWRGREREGWSHTFIPNQAMLFIMRMPIDANILEAIVNKT